MYIRNTIIACETRFNCPVMPAVMPTVQMADTTSKSVSPMAKSCMPVIASVAARLQTRYVHNSADAFATVSSSMRLPKMLVPFVRSSVERR